MRFARGPSSESRVPSLPNLKPLLERSSWEQARPEGVVLRTGHLLSCHETLVSVLPIQIGKVRHIAVL